MYMNNMLEGTEKFNQDLSGWDVKSVKEFSDFSKGSKLEKDYLPIFEEENTNF